MNKKNVMFIIATGFLFSIVLVTMKSIENESFQSAGIHPMYGSNQRSNYSWKTYRENNKNSPWIAH